MPVHFWIASFPVDSSLRLAVICRWIGNTGVVGAFQYEPEAGDIESQTREEKDSSKEVHCSRRKDLENMDNTDWCGCGRCSAMPTAIESDCCVSLY